MTKHRQETMFLQQCFLLCPGLKRAEIFIALSCDIIVILTEFLMDYLLHKGPCCIVYANRSLMRELYSSIGNRQ